MTVGQAVGPFQSLPGAVPADGVDAGVAAHYGDPFREQRTLLAGRVSSTSRTGASSASGARTG